MRLHACLLVVALAGLVACFEVKVEPDLGAAIAIPEAGIPRDDDTADDASSERATTNDDAGVDADSADTGVDAGDPVFGTSAFVPFAPGLRANAVAQHPAAELPLEGKNCFKAGGCHSENNTQFGFAGTVYRSINGGPTWASVEVRVVDANGGLVGSAYTDADGNFWFNGSKPPTGARVGVRRAGSTMVQAGVVEGGACNSGLCHGQVGMRIYLP